MPIYDYQCQSCGEVYEQIVQGPGQKTTCPDCDSKATQRLPALVRVHGSSPKAPILRSGENGCAPTG